MGIIYTIPQEPRFKTSGWGIQANTQVSASPTTSMMQTLELPGIAWCGTFNVPPLRPEEAGVWTAFLVRLRGRAGRFYGYDPDRRIPRGTARHCVVAEGGQTGTFLNVKEMIPGASLVPGDYFSYEAAKGRELHMIVEAAVANAQGRATLVLEPPLRASPNADTVLTLVNPSCMMMLTEDRTMWDTTEASVYGISFPAIEAMF